MGQPLNFQSIILSLQNYWAEQGCLIWQPYYTQVGAGTMNPATYLRVLGPEPWNVAYVEPSIRPDDGRYGENPNRMQQHYQFQVILKPDPGNPQEMYLHSLESLGIDPRQHDIRFVEDNWESPALGAWGLGWEVWLDGQEITQFTYFQQAGGIVLDPVSVEITYGLDRIAMALQRVRNFRDVQWSPSRKYGDVNLQGEQEHSKYYFEIADVDRLRQMYQLFEKEAETALAENLILPAHDYVLKCSHTFNILDTRGAIGVTERQALFGRMRDLSRRVAEGYVAQREALGFPWLEKQTTRKEGPQQNTKASVSSASHDLKSANPLLLEIGTEELPTSDMETALAQLKERVPVLLDDIRLSYNGIHIFGTPRRLVVRVDQLAACQPDETLVIKGPPAARAFDASGAPTQAAIGFAHGKGIPVEDLKVQEIDGGQYVTAQVHQTGKSAIEVLSDALPGLIAGLRFDKSMRWNSSGVSFSRPLRWLLALYADEVVLFEYAGLQTGRQTHGLRFHTPDVFEINSVDDYFKFLSTQGIILEPGERRKTIQMQVEKLALEVGGEIKIDQALLDEVTQLVEAPMALRGSFDESHLNLPGEVLVSVMKKHQRYFPVYKKGDLLPYFIAVRNGDGQFLDVVRDGNEQVIQARFADAAFFISEDVEHPLADYVPRLATLVFQFKLGSMLDKTNRVCKLVDKLAGQFKLDQNEIKVAHRAAELCKADLVTKMVIEMTSLQGIMGKYYAGRSGESDLVADAIFEHYLPRFAGDALPKSKPGLLVGLSDRLDSLAGLFAAGLAPTGAKDPFAQRRMALGMVQNLISWDLDFDLQQGISMAAAGLPITASEESQASCLEFIVGRLRSLLLDQGYRYDVVDTILAVQGSNPAGAMRAVRALSEWVIRPDWNTILPAYSRCVRITRDQKERFRVNPVALSDSAEKDLLVALEKAETISRQIASVEDFFRVFIPLIPSINNFFDKVLVMSDNREERSNRLGLLQRIVALADGVMDLSNLEGF